MSQPHKCPDCGGVMEEGFIPDSTYGAVLQTHWHRGTAEKTSFLGIDTGAKIDRSKMLPICSCRCSDCGLLRFFAKP